MTLISKITSQILNPLIGVLVAFACVVFLWGIIEFIWGAGDENKVATGKKHIFWGLVGLFIIVGVGGIIRIIISFIQSL